MHERVVFVFVLAFGDFAVRFARTHFVHTAIRVCGAAVLLATLAMTLAAR